MGKEVEEREKRKGDSDETSTYRWYLNPLRFFRSDDQLRARCTFFGDKIFERNVLAGFKEMWHVMSATRIPRSRSRLLFMDVPCVSANKPPCKRGRDAR